MVKVTTQLKSTDIPHELQQLLDKREQARVNRDFTLSDLLRSQINNLGYEVMDRAGGYEVSKLGDSGKIPAARYLILFGSGEVAPSSVDIYRQTFFSLGKRDIQISLITTPAGFQPNVEHVYGEIKDFLLAALPDFNLNIKIIFANTLADANDPELVTMLDGSDVIFLGPGSPTYAAKNLTNSLLLAKIIEQVKNNTTLILASAATIAFSHHALPVYEIYKVGEPLHWQKGLNIYEQIWQDMTIIPHFNNTEGGANLDTSYCYIGKDRAEKLFVVLPSNTPLLGIDEHTALIVDLATFTEQIRGKGTIHKIEL